jgi:hypothetical protein
MTALPAADDDGIDWLAPAPTAAPKRARGDALTRALTPKDPAAEEAKRLANIAAEPPLPVGERGTLDPNQAWLVADWVKLPDAVALGRVRFLNGKQAQGEVADLKRPLIQINETPGEAWRYLCLAFAWANPPAVYREISKVRGLEWINRQATRSQR